MVNLWYAEAGANEGFPLDDRSALEIFVSPRPQLSAPRDRYVYFPDHAEVPEAQAVVVRGRSFVIGALVDIPGRARRACCSPRARGSVVMRSTSRTTACTTSTASSACSSR